jgi:hypothetical protein
MTDAHSWVTVASDGDDDFADNLDRARSRLKEIVRELGGEYSGWSAKLAPTSAAVSHRAAH